MDKMEQQISTRVGVGDLNNSPADNQINLDIHPLNLDNEVDFDSETSPNVSGDETGTSTVTVGAHISDLELDPKRDSIIVNVQETPSSLLDAVVKHENNCEDDLDSTIAMCNIFRSEGEMQVNSTDRKSPEDTRGEILITDLDSLSCHMKFDEKDEGQLDFDTSDENDSCITNLPNDRSESPKVIILDLESQDDYVSNFLETGSERMRKNEEDELFSSMTSEQMHASATEDFCFVHESSKEFRRDEDNLLQNQNEVISTPEFREKKLHSTSPIFFHDLNCDFEQAHSRSLDKGDSTEIDCNSIFYFPQNYSQKKDETRRIFNESYSDPSQKISHNANYETDFGVQCYDFSVNDSGFFDTSCVSSENNEPYDMRASDSSIKTTKCNLNGQYFDSLSSIHSESHMPSHLKLSSHFVKPLEGHLVAEDVSSISPFESYCFTNTPNPAIPNHLLYKQPVMEIATSYTQSIPSYSDLSDACSLPVYPEWTSWTNGSKDLSFATLPPPPYVTPQMPQKAKYNWHGDENKIENAEVYREYLKQAATENDGEETEDADEFDDVPIFFNASSSNFVKGYEAWASHSGTSHSTSCYTEGAPGSQFGSESMTPSPCASNAPSETSSLYSPVSMPSNRCQLEDEKPETAFMPYEFGKGPKLPYPSMADMMRSSRSNSTKPSGSGIAVKRMLADAVSQGGRIRKNQIQSDTISTSTSKGNRYKKKWTSNTSSKKTQAGPVSDLCINLDGLDEREQNLAGPRRHNEPLKQHAINIMSHWYEEHLDNPYPTKADKVKMATDGGISVTQVKSWFANKRNRTNNTKPKVQKKAMEEKLKELFKDITCNRTMPLSENSHIIKQLSGIIQTCHSKHGN